MLKKISLVFACLFVLALALILAQPVSIFAAPSGWSSAREEFLTGVTSFDAYASGEKIYVVFSTDNRLIQFTDSEDGGVTWSAPRPVNDGLNPSYSPRIVVNRNGETYVAFYGNSPVFQERNGLYAYHSADGNNWACLGATPPVLFDGVPCSVRNISVDIGGNGQPIVAWENKVSSSNCYLTNLSTMANAGFTILEIPKPTGEGWDAIETMTPVIGCSDGGDYCFSYIARTLKSGTGVRESVRTASFRESIGWLPWLNEGENRARAVESTEYGTTERFGGLDYQCVVGTEMKLAYTVVTSGTTWSVKTVRTDANSYGHPALVAADVSSGTPVPKCCPGADTLCYRGVPSENEKRRISDGDGQCLVFDRNNVADLRLESGGTFSPVFLLWRNIDGTLSIKRTDHTPPSCSSIEINEALPRGGEVYAREPFPVCANDVVDSNWMVTGSDSFGSFNDGVSKVEYSVSPVGKPAAWQVFDTSEATGGETVDWKGEYLVEEDGSTDGIFDIKATVVDTAGNRFDCQAPCRLIVDTCAPASSLTVDGIEGENGWYLSECGVSISVDDASGAIGLTRYRLRKSGDEQWNGWLRYEDPFVLGEGEWEVEYYSVDAAGNTEEVVTGQIRIDMTEPVAMITSPTKETIQTGFEELHNEQVSGMGTDAGSGIEETVIVVDEQILARKTGSPDAPISCIWNVSSAGLGEHEVVLIARDAAGNIGKTTKIVSICDFCKVSYFAEGNTLANFDTYLCILNPGMKNADVRFDFMLENGGSIPAAVSVPPQSRRTYDIKQFVPEGYPGVSAKVTCSNQAIVVERPMYFDYKPDDPARNWSGGHVARGVNTPQCEYYFAEGTTRDNPTDGVFDEWLTILNPNNEASLVQVTYMLGDGSNVESSRRVQGRSRCTISVNEEIGPNRDVSVRIRSSAPIVAERPQYSSYHQFAVDGHNVIGAFSPALEWHFAEGSTRNGFEEWITIQNPGDETAKVNFTYMSNTGTVTSRQRAIPPRSRATTSVMNDVGDNQDVSVNISSDRPVVAERPMYFLYKGKWDGSSVAMGQTEGSRTQYIAEGCTLPGFDTYYCIQNPNNRIASIEITYMLANGSRTVAVHTVAAHSRLTINMAAETGVGVGQEVSAKIVSSEPVTVERSMFFNHRSRTGGHVGSACGAN